jgi:hypothetical protein
MTPLVEARGVNGSVRVRSYYFILFLPDPIKFESKNFDLYPTRRVTDRPDLCKIIKYLLIIFIYF